MSNIVEGVHHVGITVGDLDRSIDFYCRHLSLRVCGRWNLAGEGVASAVGVPDAELTAVMLATADRRSILELVGYAYPDGQPYTLRNVDVGAAHLCFVVRDLDALYAAMISRGVVFNAPVQAGVPEGTRFAYFQDPDGINVELLEPADGLRAESLIALADVSQTDSEAAGHESSKLRLS